MRIDLHLHTTASDGQHSPTDLVALAQRFDIIAITDHDTTEGIAEAIEAARAKGSPQIIPGIELSAEDDAGDVHVLGYFVDVHDAAFQAELTQFRTDRYHRGLGILEKLASIGLPLNWDRVLAIAEGGSIGRPHIARAMVEAGYVGNVREAFDRYIANDGIAYVQRRRLSPEEALQMIHAAKGAAVLAHPGLLPDHTSMVKRLVPYGLDGVEVSHPSNSENTRLSLRGLAREFNLIMTGGSDFHGEAIKPNVQIGMETPPDGCVDLLRARAGKYAKA